VSLLARGLRPDRGKRADPLRGPAQQVPDATGKLHRDEPLRGVQVVLAALVHHAEAAQLGRATDPVRFIPVEKLRWLAPGVKGVSTLA
jgi:hypothetical protein